MNSRLSRNPAVASGENGASRAAAIHCEEATCHPKGELRSSWKRIDVEDFALLRGHQLPDVGEYEQAFRVTQDGSGITVVISAYSLLSRRNARAYLAQVDLLKAHLEGRRLRTQPEVIVAGVYK
jgi:hypothetical protein